MFNSLNLKFKFRPVTTIIICVLLLNVISLLSLYSALHQGGELKDPSLFYKQVLWIALSWIVLIVFSFIDYRLYYDLSFIAYGINVVLLVGVIFFGREAMGAQRWLEFLGVSFQPSELSKIVTILILARFFSGQKKGFLKGMLIPFGLVMVMMLFIFAQPDLGTAGIILILFFMMGFFSPHNRKYLFTFLLIGISFSPLGWHCLKDYQKKRLTVFLNPNAEPVGAGYTIIQSKISIGSGRILGKGFLSGTQNQFNFLPERHTDFIFTVIAEEWGLVGSIFLLLIYWLLLRKILDKTKELKDTFAQFLCYGISFLFFFHVFVNIGMTLGIFPVVGLPLIFLSYGGTHLVMSSVLLGIFFNIARTS